MTVLVTGGSGFVGRRLLASHPEYKSFDVFDSKGRPTNKDITSFDSIFEETKGVKGVIHLAALSRVKDCEDNPLKCVQVNVNGSLNILHAASQNNIPWVLFVSSGEVAWIEKGGKMSFSAIDNLYGITKISMELILDFYAKKYTMNTCIFRINSVIFGGRDDNPEKVFPIFLRRCLAGDALEVQNQSYEWDFLHVDDVVDSLNSEVSFLGSRVEQNCYEQTIASGCKLDLLSLASILHFFTRSKSKIVIKNKIIEKVSEEDVERIISKNKLSSHFITRIRETIDEFDQ